MALQFFIFILHSFFAVAQNNNSNANQIAISQGVASPALTHTTLFSNGFTMANPVGASYINGYKMTSELDGTDSTSFGLDAGVGDGQYGVVVGAYSNSCEGCESFVRGTMSAIWGSFGLGFGVQEDLYTMGILLNPNGSHRVGFTTEFDDPNGRNNNRLGFGLGYAYVIQQFTFSMDISKQNLESNSVIEDAYMLTPGLAVRVDIFAVSLSYNMFLNDSGNSFDNKVWVGVGVQATPSWLISLYGEYTDRWVLMASYLF